MSLQQPAVAIAFDEGRDLSSGILDVLELLDPRALLLDDVNEPQPTPGVAVLLLQSFLM